MTLLLYNNSGRKVLGAWQQNSPFKDKLKKRNKTMDEHKITKKDKIVYGITLAVIFFGVLSLGLVGMLVNILS